MFDANKSRVFDGVIGTADPGAVFHRLSLDRKRALVDVLLTVTIAPTGRLRSRLRPGVRPHRVEPLMTQEWPDVRVVCSHGLDYVPPQLVEIFTFAEKQGRWVPTVSPRCMQHIRGRRHDAAFDVDAGDLRYQVREAMPAWSMVQHGLSELLVSPADKRRAGIALQKAAVDADEGGRGRADRPIQAAAEVRLATRIPTPT